MSTNFISVRDFDSSLVVINVSSIQCITHFNGLTKIQLKGKKFVTHETIEEICNKIKHTQDVPNNTSVLEDYETIKKLILEVQ